MPPGFQDLPPLKPGLPKNASLFLDDSVKFLEKKLKVSFENKITNGFGPER